MTEENIPPAKDCQSMSDVRKGVDAIDQKLVDLLVARFSYMDAAARIKNTRHLVRDETRKAQVLANVRRLAESAALPAGLTDQLWESLVEASIAYEFDEWDNHRA